MYLFEKMYNILYNFFEILSLRIKPSNKQILYEDVNQDEEQDHYITIMIRN